MPSELDIRLAKATEMLTGEGAPMALTHHKAYGVDLPMVATAPPALPHYFAYFCAQHGDTTFIVDGEERLSFAQTYAALRRRITAFAALPIDALNRLSLQSRVDDIGRDAPPAAKG